MKTRTKKLLGGVAVVGLILALIPLIWIWRFKHFTPVEAIQDIQAAIKVRNREHPVEQFMEVRYGPMSDPANRRKAFRDFFNVGHIEGLQILVRRAPAERREQSIAAMAQWVANYRDTITPSEQESLRATLDTPAGHTTLQQATAKYLSFRCPDDPDFFPKEQTSYEWNMFLNGASYDRPDLWSPVPQSIVEKIFGGRLYTPIIGDAAAFHVAGGTFTGKNALFFDGRVDRTKKQ